MIYDIHKSSSQPDNQIRGGSFFIHLLLNYFFFELINKFNVIDPAPANSLVVAAERVRSRGSINDKEKEQILRFKKLEPLSSIVCIICIIMMN